MPFPFGWNSAKPQAQPAASEQTNANAQEQQPQTAQKDDLADFWESQPAQEQQQNQNQNQNQQQQNQAPDQRNAFAEHIKEIGLDKLDLDPVRLQQDLAEGKLDSLQEAVTRQIGRAYQQALLTSNKLMEAHMEQAIERAVTKAVGAVRAESAATKLGEDLDFVQDPVLKPIAEALLAQSVKKGKKTPEAIETVERVFERIADRYGKYNRQNYRRAAPRPGSNGFAARQDDEAAELGEVNWSEILGSAT